MFLRQRTTEAEINQEIILIFIPDPCPIPQHTLFVSGQEFLPLGWVRAGGPSATGSCCCKPMSSMWGQWGMLWRTQHPLKNPPAIKLRGIFWIGSSPLLKKFSVWFSKANLCFSRIFLLIPPRREKSSLEGEGPRAASLPSWLPHFTVHKYCPGKIIPLPISKVGTCSSKSVCFPQSCSHLP